MANVVLNIFANFNNVRSLCSNNLLFTSHSNTANKTVIPHLTVFFFSLLPTNVVKQAQNGRSGRSNRVLRSVYEFHGWAVKS